MIAAVGFDFGGFAVDQQIQHMGLDGAVDNGEVLAIKQRVEDGCFQRCRFGDRGFAGLEIDLHAILAGKALEPFGELLERIIFAGEMDAAAEADPFGLFEQRPEFTLDIAEHLVKQREIGVFAIVVNHEAGDHLHHRLDLLEIPFAQPRKRPRRIGEIEGRRADTGIEP